MGKTVSKEVVERRTATLRANSQYDRNLAVEIAIGIKAAHPEIGRDALIHEVTSKLNERVPSGAFVHTRTMRRHDLSEFSVKNWLGEDERTRPLVVTRKSPTHPRITYDAAIMREIKALADKIDDLPGMIARALREALA